MYRMMHSISSENLSMQVCFSTDAVMHVNSYRSNEFLCFFTSWSAKNTCQLRRPEVLWLLVDVLCTAAAVFIAILPRQRARDHTVYFYISTWCLSDFLFLRKKGHCGKVREYERYISLHQFLWYFLLST